MNRTVAIKEFLPGGIVMRDPDRVTVHPVGPTEQRDFEWGLQSFRKEAATLVTFRHPNIVAVYRYFEANGTAYMVMAYEAGESLGAVLARHPWLEEGEIREILVPLLDGLARVHEAGFLHRDIKPDNIYIRADGSPVLLDFGAARQALGEKSRSMTSIFTAGYAPFEQYSSRGNQGSWTDIYAMGAVLYRCVTGDKPPEAPDRIRDDPCRPAAQAAAGRYSPGFLAAIDHALKVDERERPQTIAVWRTELGLDAPALAAPAPAPRKSRLGWAVAAVILSAGVGGAAWYASQSNDEATRLEAQMKALQQRAAAAEQAAQAEAAARKKAEAEVAERQKAADAARLEAEREAQARADAEAKAAAAAKARAEAEAKHKAEEAAAAKAAEEKAKAEAAVKAKAEAEARARAEAEAKAKAKAEAEATARGKAEEDAKRRAAATQQAAATAGAGSALRNLIVGKTVTFHRPAQANSAATVFFKFEYRSNGVMSHTCYVQRPNNTTGRCKRPDGEMPWRVVGDRLCMGGVNQSCIVVEGSPDNYSFRKVFGENEYLDGAISIQ